MSIEQFTLLFFEQCKLRWKPGTRSGHLLNLNSQALPLFGDQKRWHISLRLTKRYAHLDPGLLVKNAGLITKEIEKMMNSKN